MCKQIHSYCFKEGSEPYARDATVKCHFRLFKTWRNPLFCLVGKQFRIHTHTRPRTCVRIVWNVKPMGGGRIRVGRTGFCGLPASGWAEMPETADRRRPQNADINFLYVPPANVVPDNLRPLGAELSFRCCRGKPEILPRKRPVLVRSRTQFSALSSGTVCVVDLFTAKLNLFYFFTTPSK